HTRYLLSLKGRPPLRLAGIETYERLQHVAGVSLDLLAQRYEPRLAHLYQGLQSALSPFAQTYQELRQGAAWLRDIAYILEPSRAQPPTAAQIAELGFAVHRYMNVILSFISSTYEKPPTDTSRNACIYVDGIKAQN